MKAVFTTGEAAEICKVSQQTIIRCFDSGRLKGFRVPGSRFRRIPRASLLQFMKDNNIPLDERDDNNASLDAPDSGRTRLLVVDDDPEVAELVKGVLERDGRFDVETAAPTRSGSTRAQTERRNEPTDRSSNEERPGTSRRGSRAVVVGVGRFLRSGL